MKDKKCPSPDLKTGITHLRALREKLCAQQSDRPQVFDARNFVVEELQNMHQELLKSNDAPEWCIEKVEHILSSIAAIPDIGDGTHNE